MATSSVAYNKPVLPRVSDTSDLASNRASVFSGKALDFDGVNDKVDSDFSFVGTQATISFYLSWDSYGTYNVEFILEGNANSNFMIHLGGGSGTNGIRFVMNSSVGQNLDVTNAVQPGLNHYVLTTDNSTASLYINGKLFNSQSKVLGQANTPYLGIGYRRNSPSYYLNGRLSGLKIFDQALTATQVAELYNNPEQILPTGVSAVNLKLWLPMMEGAGSYVYNGAAGSLGPELVSNGTVDEVCQKWAFTDNGYVSATGGKLVWNAPNGSGANAVQYLNIVAGRTYRVTFDYSVNRDGFSIVLGNANAQPIQTGTGTYTVDLTPTSTNSGYFSLNMSGGTGDIVGYMDNISVKEVVPQATGTINGATWVSGQGEPLPQTALIDWNKASNMLTYSEQFDTDWTRAGTSISVNETAAPNGFFTADKSTVSNTNVYHDSLLRSVTTVSGVEYETSIYAKKGNGINGIYFYHGDGGRIAKWNLNDGSYIGYAPSNGYNAYSSYGSESAGDGWFRFWARYTASSTSGNFTIGISPNTDNTVVQYTGDGVSYLYLWGAQYAPVSSTGVTPYISTGATAQTSPVLIPKGLTTGKDIFGNSIVTPRASGAFNFDGKSYASFQPNASLEIANNITLEFWAKFSVTTTGTLNYDHVIGRRDGNDSNWLRVYRASDNLIRLEGNSGNSIATSAVTNEVWYHYVATLSGTSGVIYLDGVQVSTGSISWSIVGDARPWTIGAWDLGYIVVDSYTFGDIANPRIYNYALTANQVADNFNQKASTFGKTKVTGELQAYINRTVAAGATVEAHSALLNTLTELENK